jgi:hypothetical protein
MLGQCTDKLEHNEVPLETTHVISSDHLRSQLRSEARIKPKLTPAFKELAEASHNIAGHHIEQRSTRLAQPKLSTQHKRSTNVVARHCERRRMCTAH